MSSPNKMDSQLTGLWVNFFSAAGIPSDVGATYALTFTENRIQNDMLLDLNKEYLRDMGITRMGDVIAILRHAKLVHENTARDRVLSSTKSGTKMPKVAAVTATLATSQIKQLSPASRILGHYTKNTSPVESLSSAIHMKRKLPEVSFDDVKKARLIRFSSLETTSDNEGSTTKNTVFARLGNSDTKTLNVQPPKKVFSRLGGKTELSERTPLEVPVPADALKYEGILKKTSPPKNIFTVTTTKNNVRKIAISSTMRADEVPVSVKDKLNMPKSKSVKFSTHVQYKEIETLKQKSMQPKFTKPVAPTQVFNKPERRLSMQEPLMASVKARLGAKDNYTITNNVFKRLGI